MVSEPERDRAEARRGTAAGFPETNEMSFGGSRVGGGRSLRDYRFVSTFLLRTLPQSPSVTAPSRREPLDVRNLRGMGFARSICNTNAKLAIIENEK